jgi:hypothetical protein
MFKKLPVIKFASTHPFLELPSPAKKHIPEWYKKSPRYVDGKDKPSIHDENNPSGNLGIKTCIPFLDSFTTGYIATLWQDIVVEIENGVTNIKWSTQPDVVNGRDSQGMNTFPIPHGHDDTHYIWRVPYIIQTPPGYSVLITHPYNRFDLPFTTLSAVVDSDGILASGNLPFYLKKGFEGVIEAGTPIYQITPFKREDWSSEFDESLVEANKRRKFEMTRKLMGDYKNRIWSRKNYN